MNKKKTSHRYFMLTERYLDWYEKPGYKRKGTASLDQIYVRRHPDNITLVVGTFGGKEFKIQSEGQDPQQLANEWYDKITKQMDVCKQSINSGATRKVVVNEGIPEVKPPPTKIQVSETVQQAAPPATVVQQQISAPPPAVITPPQPPIQAYATTTQFATPLSTTMISPAPIMSSPIATTTFSPFGTTTTFSPQLVMCGACRNQFANTGGNILRCPFCGFLTPNAVQSPVLFMQPTATIMPTAFVTMPTAVTYTTPFY